MKAYGLAITVRSAQIRRKIAECGFRTVNELCRQSGLQHQQISALLSRKRSPLRHDGTWSTSALGLAEVLGCTCEELFRDAQRTVALRGSQSECVVFQDVLLKLSSRVQRPLLDNPEESLLEELEERAKIDVVRRALSTLRPRNRDIVAGYFGIGCQQRTLAELAVEFNVCWQMIQRLLNDTLWRWRTDNSELRRSLLQAHQPNHAVSKADEARAQSAPRIARPAPAERNSNAQLRQRRAA
jgi:hypothetical protein